MESEDFLVRTGKNRTRIFNNGSIDGAYTILLRDSLYDLASAFFEDNWRGEYMVDKPKCSRDGVPNKWKYTGKFNFSSADFCQSSLSHIRVAALDIVLALVVPALSKIVLILLPKEFTSFNGICGKHLR
jgi:hypothetical protein